MTYCPNNIYQLKLKFRLYSELYELKNCEFSSLFMFTVSKQLFRILKVIN